MCMIDRGSIGEVVMRMDRDTKFAHIWTIGIENRWFSNHRCIHKVIDQIWKFPLFY